MAERGSPRIRQIVAAARTILEEEGPDALTMRRLADRLGIRAPSLYKHLPDKAAVEIELIADGLAELAEILNAAAVGKPETEVMPALAEAYRAYAVAHPHLYRLMTARPLPRTDLPPGAEDMASAALLRAAGNENTARAAWAFAHGMVILEIDDRFPPCADLDAAWQVGISAFHPLSRTPATSQPPDRSTSAPTTRTATQTPT